MFRLTPNEKDLGEGFRVRRTLPQIKRRMVGPFIFWDHMGPVNLVRGDELQVRSHPHIGLATITYLFSGEILHRDSLGNEQPIRPGEVNWMTAGEGIAHSERSQKNGGSVLEGIQVWVALPLESEDVAPNFFHIKEPKLPLISCGDVDFRLIAGKALDHESPVPVYSDLFYLATTVKAGSKLRFQVPVGQEGAIYVANGKLAGPDGALESAMEIYEPGELMEYEALEDSQVMIFGGAPFPEKRHVWWNFVSSDKEKIEAAKKRWTAREFAEVIHETEWIPLPEN